MLAIAIVEAAAIVLLGVLVVGLLQSHAEILRTLHDLGEGADPARPTTPTSIRIGRRVESPARAAHDLSGTTLDGEAVSIGLVGAPYRTLLAFLSGTCYTCEPFWQAFADGVELPGGGRVIAVVQSADSAARLRRLAGDDLLVVVSDDAWAQYEVPGSPHFVLLDGHSGQVIGEGTAATWDAVADLLLHATGPVDPMPAGRDNPARIDRELLAAGIGPGHDSLYPERGIGGAAGTDS